MGGPNRQDDSDIEEVVEERQADSDDRADQRDIERDTKKRTDDEDE